MKLLITESNINEDTSSILQGKGIEVIIPKEEIPDVHTFDRSSLLDLVAKEKPDTLLVGLKHKINEEVLKLAPIKVIFTRTTNITDHIDYKYCEEKGIEIVNLKGEDLKDVTGVAEACLGAMIQLMRMESPSEELRGKTLGLWGFGRIGKHLATLGIGMGMKVIYHDPAYPKSMPIDKLLEEVHVLSIHASSTDDNIAMVKYSHFEKMTQHPYVLNSTRPWLIEALAVHKALDNELISGYWSDTPLDFEHPKLIIWNKAGDTYDGHIKTERIILSKILEWYKLSAK